jgi:dTDP-4-amino-4,6-dideoxygalactose transaminase
MNGTELDFVREAFVSNYIAPAGPMLAKLESAFIPIAGAEHCLAVASGTAAMHLVLRHLGIGAGDTVLASSLTFIGSVSPAAHEGANIVFVDADEATWTMDPERLEQAIARLAARRITPKAVIPTDLYGQPADLDVLRSICSPQGIPIIADAAESLGATYRGAPAGSGVRASIFSFNGNKIITGSSGGMLASADADLIAHARKLATQAREDAPHYEHNELGFNYRMSNVIAAIVLGQLGTLQDRVRQRQRIRGWYREYLESIEGISFMPEAAYGESNAWLTVILIDRKTTSATPETIRLALEENNIESRPTWKPMHMQPVFAHCRVFGGEVSERIYTNGLCLPSGSAMSRQDVARVSDIVRRTILASLVP